MAGKRKAATAEDGSPTRKRRRAAKSSKRQKQSQTDEPITESCTQHRLQKTQSHQPQQSLAITKPPAIQRDLLARFFPRVETLRDYLLTQLPSSSRLRRKKLSSVGRGADATAIEQLLGHVLDTTLVACAGGGQDSCLLASDQDRERMHQTFSQTKRADESYVTVSNAAEGTFCPQAEIVDFVIWLLFSRTQPVGFKSSGFSHPDNVLCHGYRRGQRPPYLGGAADVLDAGPAAFPASTIPGLSTTRNPQNAQTFKEPPWPQLLAVLGASAEKIMTSLLLDCSLFLSVDAGVGNYIQLTGQPLFNVVSSEAKKHVIADKAATTVKRPSEIVFARHHMFYRSPALTKGSKVHFGLSPRHPLNKPTHLATESTAKNTALESPHRASAASLAMYIFPREFGLCDASTASAEKADSLSRYKSNLTLRESEIAAKLSLPDGQEKTKLSIPKRLRGDAMALIEKMQKRHSRCAYLPLLDHYCPDGRPPNEYAARSSETVSASANSAPLIVLATPLTQVSAFCRAVIQKVVPPEFWGSDVDGTRNKTAVLRKVDFFIRLQRYENLNLHAVLHGVKIAKVKWLQPPKLKYNNMSQTDFHKRQALFAEFLYFVFDGLLMPLIAANFYVTESSTHRGQLFYFRHDIWRRISEPALTALISARLEPLVTDEALRRMEVRGLGFGKLRLLPKKTTVRPIVNMRRIIPSKGNARMPPSINTVLRPVDAMLKLEMKEHPDRLGSSMFSTHSIYTRLKSFRERMHAKNKHLFYFAKVDVQAAFDTIPQKAMIRLLGTVPEHPSYRMNQHVEITPTGVDPSRKVTTRTAPGSLTPSQKGTAATPRQVWRTLANASDDATGFHEAIESSIAHNKRNTVFVESAFAKTHYAEPLARLAATHIWDNIIKVGSKFYRQKVGIPQGSVLSSTLCSYFYADLEEKELGFLRASAGEDQDCILLRLIDDFLLISTDRAKAARFVEVMQRGHPAYGVDVNPSKSLVNFALQVDGKPVPRLAKGQHFPYCGTEINCSNLNLCKDSDTPSSAVFNAISVEHLRSQGYHARRKVLNYFQIQSHRMFFDTSHNSRRTVLRNLHAVFAETAHKMWAYARCMPKTRRPSAPLVIRTIQDVGVLAQRTLGGKAPTSLSTAYEFSVPKAHLQYLLFHAFLNVLGKKQTGYKDVVIWLRDAIEQLREPGRLRLPQEFTIESVTK
ncbi:Telomerase reverse transcriptase [Sporothrix epigloea]|uniref:Telomerase reverse transcriptase n=1 Tax=Sporothrix epigloea TaxID=1892477 RepID=A0ABP0DUL2_9PEZI